MKKTVVILCIAVTSAFVACQKKDDGNNVNSPAAPTATTPQPCNYPGAQPNCQYVNGQVNPNYNGYNTNGYYPYYNNGYYNGYYYNNQYYSYNSYQPNSWYYGSWYWPTQWNGSGCMSGYQPTCSQGFGVACAPSSYFSYNVIYFNYGLTYPTQNSPYNANPQMTYQGAGCPSTAAQSCDTRANNCPSGSTCQASGGGSIYGICIKNP